MLNTLNIIFFGQQILNKQNDESDTKHMCVKVISKFEIQYRAEYEASSKIDIQFK